ncbi:MAG: hypothetical protein RBT75_08730 [Anaerolineae bacterium]|jgi:hypothetical protein|nr:hypothetical protein [Anaerolineae bacterium]
MHWILRVPPDFSLKQLIQRSRWMILPPFSTDRAGECLERVERLSSGHIIAMTVTQVLTGLHIEADIHLNAAQAEELSQKTWRMLRLGETFGPFLQRARNDIRLRRLLQQGVRFLRGADFFEDLLKALFLGSAPPHKATQQFSQLVDTFGDVLPSNPTRHALPTAQQLLEQEASLASVLGTEQGTIVWRAAATYQQHATTLEALPSTALAFSDVLSQLHGIPGVTHSACDYLLLALGRYDGIPGAPITASVSGLEQWQPWSGLVYWLEHSPQ